MTPELAVVLIATAAGAAAGLRKLLLAMVDRRVEKFKIATDAEKNQAEQDRKDREQKRKIELEEMRAKTAKAQADATQAKADNENLTHLTAAVLEFMQAYRIEQHANQSQLSNQAQSIGDMSESLDRVALVVNDNTVVTRATGGKVDLMVQRFNHFYTHFALEFPVENTIKTIFEDFKRDLLQAIESRPRAAETSSNGKTADE